MANNEPTERTAPPRSPSPLRRVYWGIRALVLFGGLGALAFALTSLFYVPIPFAGYVLAGVPGAVIGSIVGLVLFGFLWAEEGPDWVRGFLDAFRNGPERGRSGGNGGGNDWFDSPGGWGTYMDGMHDGM